MVEHGWLREALVSERVQNSLFCEYQVFLQVDMNFILNIGNRDFEVTQLVSGQIIRFHPISSNRLLFLSMVFVLLSNTGWRPARPRPHARRYQNKETLSFAVTGSGLDRLVINWEWESPNWPSPSLSSYHSSLHVLYGVSSQPTQRQGWYRRRRPVKKLWLSVLSHRLQGC